MAKANLAELPAKLYTLLSPLSSDERVRVVQATMILLGENQQIASAEEFTDPNSGSGAGTGEGSKDIQKFLNDKNPKNKGETLAVVARYREVHEKQETHSKADFKNLILAARRNFDDKNFGRDINNAKRQSGFFTLNTARDATKLSYYGQQFIDALPDRGAAAKIKRPKIGGNKKKKAKKSS